ncbi:hypothetical protein HZI73_14405 [Vallitalea pronyensis]|uniref:Uncharacterized protein n=1 Tax=Vallitalea pronyensis TaxID=1348613 RepID=A0A8J8MKI4_9FIRM|nr:hypothetical protein [Vallitalea pronyensis]QUI23405.1 hypothetical protein HZI73_14405 [Vallitalea pronyensis]
MRKSTQENSESMKKTFKNNGKFNTEFGQSEMEEYEHRREQIDRDEENTEY